MTRARHEAALRVLWREKTGEYHPIAWGTREMSAHGWTTGHLRRLLALALTMVDAAPRSDLVEPGEEIKEEANDLLMLAIRVQKATGTRPMEALGWAVEFARVSAATGLRGWQRLPLDDEELAAWYDAALSAEIAVLAWSAGLTPAETAARWHTGTLDFEGLAVLAALRGHPAP